MPGVVPHVTWGDSAPASTATSLSNPAPASVCLAADDPFERRVVGGDHPRPAAGLDRHVAHRHPPLHREALDNRPGVLDDMPDSAGGPDLADRSENQVLRGHPEAELALVADHHRARLLLLQRLGGEHVLDLARADAEGECAECAVRRGVRVAAHDGHARLGHTQLGADHVHDALAARADRVDRHAELAAVLLERLDLHAREVVADLRGGVRAVRRDVVVGRRERPIRPPHAAARQAQALECLRRGDLVHQVKVDVEQPGADLVLVPDLVEECPCHVSSSAARP
jgi:hypothetical protein